MFFAKEFESDLSEAENEALVALFEQVGLSSVLRANPFAYLRLKPSVYLENSPKSGWYSFDEGGAEISISRDSNEYGQTFEWGLIKKLSCTAPDEFGAVLRTLVHEIGHHLHQLLKVKDLVRFKQTCITPCHNACSYYGTVNGLEYFAETFAAYIYFRTELIVHDGVGYTMLESALESMGVKVNEYDPGT